MNFEHANMTRNLGQIELLLSFFFSLPSKCLHSHLSFQLFKYALNSFCYVRVFKWFPGLRERKQKKSK